MAKKYTDPRCLFQPSVHSSKNMDLRVGTVFVVLASLFSPSSQQCPVTQPTITSDVVCQVSTPPSQGPPWGVSYTCNEPGNVIIWSGSFFTGDVTVKTLVRPFLILPTVSGVNIMESHTNERNCVNSTLIFTGNNLTTLNGATLNCRRVSPNTANDSITISVPGPPGTPQTLRMSSPTTCGVNGNQVTLEWSPPTDTGGMGMEIERYLVTVTGPPGFNCPPDQCNVTTTSTTITGLKCNTSYMVTVRAVNCIREGSPTQPVTVILEPPALTLQCDSLVVCPGDDEQRMCTCIFNGPLRWTTDRNGVFSGVGTTFFPSSQVGTNTTAMGFTAILTSNTNGILTSIMTFTPTAVTSSGIAVTCNDPLNPGVTTNTANLAVIAPGPPGTPQTLRVSSPTTCDVNGNQVTLKWSPPTDTGGMGVEIERYLVAVTGPPGFNCPPDQCNVTTTNTTITGLKCNTSYRVTVRAVNCIGEGSPTQPVTVILEPPAIGAPSITRACIDDQGVSVEWMPDSSTCYTVTNYTITSNIAGVSPILVAGSSTFVNVSVNVTSVDYINIILTANTDCGISPPASRGFATSAYIIVPAVPRESLVPTPSLTTALAPNCPAPISQLTLGLGIPLTFLLTAIISSLLSSLITYLCLVRGRNHKFTPPVQEPVLTSPAPVYEPVSATSGEVEMKTNVAYGHVTTGGHDHVTYENVAQ